MKRLRQFSSHPEEMSQMQVECSRRLDFFHDSAASPTKTSMRIVRQSSKTKDRTTYFSVSSSTPRVSADEDSRVKIYRTVI